MLPMADKQAYLWLKLHERNLRITSNKRRVWTANVCLTESVVCLEDSRVNMRRCGRWQSTSGGAMEDNHWGVTQGGREGSICFSFSQCGSFPMGLIIFMSRRTQACLWNTILKPISCKSLFPNNVSTKTVVLKCSCCHQKCSKLLSITYMSITLHDDFQCRFHTTRQIHLNHHPFLQSL